MSIYSEIFNIYFFVTGFILVVLGIYLYTTDYFQMNNVKEGLSEANMSRLVAINYALEQISNSISPDDYALVKKYIDNMSGLTYHLENASSVDETSFKNYVGSMQENVNNSLKALQGKNAATLLKEKFFTPIMDSLNKKFKKKYASSTYY